MRMYEAEIQNTLSIMAARMNVPSKCVGAIALAILTLQAVAARAQDGPRNAGPTKRGYLLPNRLKEVVQKRQESRADIVAKRLDQLQRDAEGLGR